MNARLTAMGTEDETKDAAAQDTPVGSASTKRKLPLGLTGRQGLSACIAIVVALALGVGVGFLAAQPSLASSEAETRSAEQRGDSLSEKLDETRADFKALLAQQSAVETKVAKRKTELDVREFELVAREGAVTDREAAVTAAEAVVAASQFSSGVHVIGTTVQAGTYSTPGGTSCYYVWKTGTGADADIIDNNIVDGPATVTLNDGDVFESSRCGTWQKVG